MITMVWWKLITLYATKHIAFIVYVSRPYFDFFVTVYTISGVMKTKFDVYTMNWWLMFWERIHAFCIAFLYFLFVNKAMIIFHIY